ncbi:hypothetical protein F5Y19DRAFT_276440 [Xylariaceae sp. FL1651]|nr:hypothetical protein F5Y19DRAFT_276440 [Xylariaceae sp. FL1651]
MNHLHNAEQLEIEQLRAQLRSSVEDLSVEDLKIARQQISQLRSSARQTQPSLSSPGISELFVSAQDDFRLSAVPASQKLLSRSSTTIPRSNSGRVHSRHSLDPRSSSQHSHGPHAVKRPRTMSQQIPSSQKMDRTPSNLSTRSAGPFTGNAPVSPPPIFQTNNQQTKHSEQVNYLSSDNLINFQALANATQPPSIEKQHQRMSTLTEMEPTMSELVDPGLWLAKNATHAFDLGVLQFSSASQQSNMDVSNFNMNVSVCGSMTSGPTYDTAPMTRQNSQFDNHSVAGGVRMISLGSHMSQGQDAYFPESCQQHIEFSDVSPLGKRPSPEDTLFAVGSSLTPPAAHQYATTAPNDGLSVASDMERTLSSTSTTSIKSTSSSLSARAKESLKQQNQRALNAPLKPKPSVDENETEPPADVKKDGKAIISKAKYVRPRQPKVFCNECDEHKEGFRGEHELRRHKDAKHQPLVRKFICVHPNEQGLPVNVQIVNQLSKCKACKTKKRYGAYYNAAAHLRRTHFKEKPSRSKNKNSGMDGGDDEKRGGKGGGDWPSMHELKNWMKEILVRQDEQYPKDDDDLDEDMDNIQHSFGGIERDSTVAEILPSGLNATGLTNLDYNFPDTLMVNTDITYVGTMPLSSADFNFNNAISVPPDFTSDVVAYSAIDHTNPLSSAVSSSATVTPLTVFNDAQHRFDDVDYHYAQ